MKYALYECTDPGDKFLIVELHEKNGKILTNILAICDDDKLQHWYIFFNGGGACWDCDKYVKPLTKKEVKKMLFIDAL